MSARPTNDSLLHVLRNPHGWSDDTVHAARLMAADRIEQLARELEVAAKEIQRGNEWFKQLCQAERELENTRERAKFWRERKADTASALLRELVEAGNHIIEQCGLPNTDPAYKAASTRNWEAWRAAESYLRSDSLGDAATERAK